MQGWEGGVGELTFEQKFVFQNCLERTKNALQNLIDFRLRFGGCTSIRETTFREGVNIHSFTVFKERAVIVYTIA